MVCCELKHKDKFEEATTYFTDSEVPSIVLASEEPWKAVAMR